MPVLFAPAKVNLTLEILSRRDDGYHTLRSVMVPIGLQDRITLEPAAQPSFEASDPELAGDDNLVARALKLCAPDATFAVRLEKAIPTGAGLGGGSSDAAAVLLAAMNGELGAVPERDWLALARELGSDVPFFLTGTAALVEGTGERVTALGALPPWWVVVARPHVAVATADAYRRLDAARAAKDGEGSRTRSESVSLRMVDALQRTDFAAASIALSNDFHQLIVDAYPEIARAEAALAGAGAPTVLLSGSGSCVFALCSTETDARAIAARVDRSAVAMVAAAPLRASRGWRG